MSPWRLLAFVPSQSPGRRERGALVFLLISLMHLDLFLGALVSPPRGALGSRAGGEMSLARRGRLRRWTQAKGGRFARK